MSYTYGYNLGDITDGTMFQGIVKKPAASTKDITDGTMFQGIVKKPAAPATQATTSSVSTKDILLSTGAKAIDLLASRTRKQELEAEARSKMAETQRINAAGSNIQKYILPIAVGGTALIGIIYFLRKK